MGLRVDMGLHDGQEKCLERGDISVCLKNEKPEESKQFRPWD